MHVSIVWHKNFVHFRKNYSNKRRRVVIFRWHVSGIIIYLLIFCLCRHYSYLYTNSLLVACRFIVLFVRIYILFFFSFLLCLCRPNMSRSCSLAYSLSLCLLLPSSLSHSFVIIHFLVVAFLFFKSKSRQRKNLIEILHSFRYNNSSAYR